MQMPRMRILVLAAALAAAFGASGGQAAEPDKPVVKPKEAAAPAPAPAEAPGGLTVFVDPDTKKIRPPEPGEFELLLKGQAVKPLAAPRVLTNLPPGAGVGLALDSSYEMFMVVTKKPDGTLATSCVTGGAEAAVAVSAGAPLPKAKPKEAPDAR
jgi:hypothetical protein